MGAIAGETLNELTGSFWFRIGNQSAEVFECHKKWLFRRVESIEFVDRRSVLRSVSVDFEVPKHLPSLEDRAPEDTFLVPVAVIQKWPPTMDFHLVDQQGHTLSRYLGVTTDRLDLGLLCGTIDLALGAAGSWRRLDSRLLERIAEIIRHPRPSQTVVAGMVNELSNDLQRASRPTPEVMRSERQELSESVAKVVDLVARLAAGTILWVAVRGPTGADRIVKFSYLGAHLVKRPKFGRDQEQTSRIARFAEWARATPRRIAISCSWKKRNLLIPLLHTGREVRYHLDIRAPGGSVEMLEATALGLRSAGEESEELPLPPESVSVVTFAEKYPRRLAPPDEWVGPEDSGYFMDYGRPRLLASTRPYDDDEDEDDRPDGASAEISDRQAHVYLGPRGAPSHRVLLQLKLTGARQGLIQGCAAAAVVIMLLMIAVWVGLDAAKDHVDGIVVLLSVVPVVLGYVVVSPDEQPFEHEHLKGVRTLALLSGALPIFGALFLVLTDQGPKDAADITIVRPAWTVLTSLSIVVAALLVLSWFNAERSKAPAEAATPVETLSPESPGP